METKKEEGQLPEQECEVRVAVSQLKMYFLHFMTDFKWLEHGLLTFYQDFTGCVY